MTDQQTWLVTGCSSGLGECLVRAILAAGDQVIATARARDKSALERLAPLKEAGAAVLELDVTAPAEVLNAKAKEAWSIYGKVDVLVNNAAYIDAGVFEEIDEAFLTRALRNNAFGPLNLTRAFLPYMRSRQMGTIVFMSSVGAYYGAPGASAYAASKGLLEGLVPSLALEIEPFGLRTCMVTPGYFRTSVMSSGNILYRAPNPLPEYAEMNKLIQAGCSATDGNQPGDPSKAAALVVDAVKCQGRCASKLLPALLPVGPDALKAIRDNSQAKLKICDDWEDMASATNL
ncbi:Short-chain dehydrogenase/reductase SDR [Penicillium riverlandense]|uniref:Short-chain dehydrogenase/reductase SDR n=1 Tax=Penicillium riverlandense TaxID=1903569 RepID=UPI002548BA78|nr:Short-chain dehydrogenase/reductase SDR [Penicillium riverlandense]KAJ5818339.1 Short-chain dehydrogenase/reductase SDR [Penicillium riverlandense]